VEHYGDCVSNSLIVTSSDGTVLRGVSSGAGRPVVLVHGTMGNRNDWFETARRLAASYRVTAFDRRGRGESADSPEYSIEREIEDLHAVIDEAGPPVYLIGHSFGAVLALLAAARFGEQIAKLVVYEPPIGDSTAADEWLEQLEALIVAGDLDAAVRSFATAASVTTDEQEAIQGNVRASAAQRDAVRTAVREIRAAKAVLPIDASVLSKVTVPTLVLIGAKQDHPSYNGLKAIAHDLSHATIAEVPGHHLALVFAPDAFVAEIRRFLIA
jgi:pimeloyl-ACP methyl ester carboxylesterase